MIPHFLLCAERAARTTEGSFVLHGVLERIVAKEEPTKDAPLTIPAMSVAFEIRDAELDRARQVRVTMRHRESNEELFNHEFPVEATNDPQKKITGLLNFHLLPIRALGAYDVRVFVDGAEIVQNYFLVVKAAA